MNISSPAGEYPYHLARVEHDPLLTEKALTHSWPAGAVKPVNELKPLFQYHMSRTVKEENEPPIA